MDLKYFILGVNIALISALLTLYGLLVNNSGLVGLFASALIMGLVIITLSFTTREGLLNVLLNYSAMLTKCTTNIVEDFDLLEANLMAIKKDSNVYIVLTRSNNISLIKPGVGFEQNTPYLALPVGDLMKDIEELGEANESMIEARLSEVFAEELSVCRRIQVKQYNKTIKLTLAEVDENIRGFLKYPLDPVLLLAMIALNRLINKDLVLKEKSLNLNNLIYVFEVVNHVEAD